MISCGISYGQTASQPAAPATTSAPSAADFEFVPPTYDREGILRPRQKYTDTITRGMEFILKQQEPWAGDNTVLDEEGRTRPGYFFYSMGYDKQMNAVGQAGTNRGAAYPAFHHAIYIETFLDYYVYSGNPESLQRARDLADWNIAHSTPADCLYPYIPYSTIYKGKPGGGPDGDAIVPSKGGIMGMAYLRLYRMTRDEKYLQAAERIAITLQKTQRPKGNWYYRVNPVTGKVTDPYSSAMIYPVILFEALDELTGKPRFADAAQKALQWILSGPAKTMNWNCFFEDVVIAENPQNRINWDAIDTAIYFLKHSDRNKEYVKTAEKIAAWVEKNFVKPDEHYPTSEAVYEQFVCYRPMSGHTGHWALLLCEFYRVTGDDAYRKRVLNIASYITYHLQKDNHFSVGPNWGKSCWYSLQFGPILHLITIMGEFPQAMSRGESHLLRTTAAVQSIRYEPETITYTTDAASTDVLKLAFIPDEIRVNGKLIQEGDEGPNRYELNPLTLALRLHHEKGEVVVLRKMPE